MAIIKRLFVGGLHPDITSDELKERFGKFGEISKVDVKIRNDAEGKPFNTFAHLTISSDEKLLSKCVQTYNKTKWKGKELLVQVAKQSFMERLQEERSALKNKTKEIEEKVLNKPGVENIAVKGAKPGEPVPGKEKWVFSKYGRALPVIDIQNKGKLTTVDPSKFCHNIKVLKEEALSSRKVDALTWEMDERDDPQYRKRKGDLPDYKTKMPKLTDSALDMLHRKTTIKSMKNAISLKATADKIDNDVFQNGGSLNIKKCAELFEDNRFKDLNDYEVVSTERKVGTRADNSYNSDSDDRESDDTDEIIAKVKKDDKKSKNTKLRDSKDKLKSKSPKNRNSKSTYSSHLPSKLSKKEREKSISKNEKEKTKIASRLCYNSDSDSNDGDDGILKKAQPSKSRHMLESLRTLAGEYSSIQDYEMASSKKVSSDSEQSSVNYDSDSFKTKMKDESFQRKVLSNDKMKTKSKTRENEFLFETKKENYKMVKNWPSKKVESLSSNGSSGSESDSDSDSGQKPFPRKFPGKVDYSKLDAVQKLKNNSTSEKQLPLPNLIKTDLENSFSTDYEEKSAPKSKTFGKLNTGKSPKDVVAQNISGNVKQDKTKLKNFKSVSSGSDSDSSVGELRKLVNKKLDSKICHMDIKKDVSKMVHDSSSEHEYISDANSISKVISKDHSSSEPESHSSDSDSNSDSTNMNKGSSSESDSDSDSGQKPFPRKFSGKVDYSKLDTVQKPIKLLSSKNKSVVISKDQSESESESVSSDSDSNASSDSDSNSSSEDSSIKQMKQMKKAKEISKGKLPKTKDKESHSDSVSKDPSSSEPESQTSDSDSSESNQMTRSTDSDSSDTESNKLNNTKTTSKISTLENVKSKVKDSKNASDNAKSLIDDSGSSSEEDEKTKLQNKALKKMKQEIAKKKHEEVNTKRLDSLKIKQKETDSQKLAIKAALASLDSGKTMNKKIVFDSDEDEDEEKEVPAAETDNKIRAWDLESSSDESAVKDGQSPAKAGKTSKSNTNAKKRSGVSLFDSDSSEESDDDSDQEMFKVKPQFQGKKGQKLLKLQQRFEHDDRFKMDEKFKESDSDEESEGNENDLNDVSNSILPTKSEKMQSLRVLESLVGPKAMQKADRRNKKKTVSILPMTRFDPTNEDHQQYVIQKQDTPKEKKKKQKASTTSTAETADSKDEAEVEIPEVSKETFFEVASDIKSLFGAKENSGGTFNFFGGKVEAETEKTPTTFDFFGAKNEDVDNKESSSEAEMDVESEDEVHESESVSKKKDKGKTIIESSGDKLGASKKFLDSSDEEDAPDNKAGEYAELSTPFALPGKYKSGFFFSKDDPRIKEGIEFFKRPGSMQDVVKHWQEVKPQLRELYRGRMKKAKRERNAEMDKKKQPWKRQKRW